MKILVLDNYDSFTYNLVHMLREMEYEPDIYRNDKISIERVNDYDKILLSPGPGIPSEAGIMMDLIHRYAPNKSILGVCLGHQAIAEAFKGKIYNMPLVLHGVGDTTKLLPEQEDYLFNGVPDSFQVCRYHSWAVEKEMPDELLVTAVDEQGGVMALRHRQYDVKGVQFHPESILTEHGARMIRNWLEH